MFCPVSKCPPLGHVQEEGGVSGGVWGVVSDGEQSVMVGEVAVMMGCGHQ